MARDFPFHILGKSNDGTPLVTWIFFFIFNVAAAACQSRSLMSYLSFSNNPGFDIYADRGPHLVRVCSIMIALSAIAVALRLTARRLSKVQLRWDDWLILIALVNHPLAAPSDHATDTYKKPLAWIPSILMIYCEYQQRHTRIALMTKIS